MVALALVSELRPSSSPGLGAMQIALLLFGLLTLLVAWLGARFPSAYRATAVVVLNTILFLAVLELGAGMGSSLGRRAPITPTVVYYADKPWGPRFLREQKASLDTDFYRPFALWQRGPTTGQHVNVGADGLRLTPGANCVPNAYRVFMMGGSTLWGMGSPDSATIPARLQALLATRTTRPICVVNLGEKGYTSMQEIVFLITRLRSDEVPDLMLFYDGVNDVRVAADEGAAGLHFGVRDLADKLEGVPRPLAVRARKSRFLSLVLPSMERPADSLTIQGYRRLGIGVDSLADQVVARYLESHRVVRALAREYGFDYVFFWQPVIWRTKKPLTIGEQRVHRNAVQGLPELFNEVYPRVHEIAPREDHLHDISDVFDGQTAFIYVDWNHVVPEGNTLVAERMLAVLDERAGGRWTPPPGKTPPSASPPASVRAAAPSGR